MVAPGEQAGAGGRAQRGGVEVGEPDALGGEAVDDGRVDVGPVAAELGEADVVEHDEDDVGRARRAAWGRGGHHGSESASRCRSSPRTRSWPRRTPRGPRRHGAGRDWRGTVPGHRRDRQIRARVAVEHAPAAVAMSGTYADVDAQRRPRRGAPCAGGHRLVAADPRVQATAPTSSWQHTPPSSTSGAARDSTCRRSVRRTAVGLDASRAMCATARRRGTVVTAEATRLPFADGSFGGPRADRMLQHVEDPRSCLAEMVRVCGRGGRVVVADPDQETLSITVPRHRSGAWRIGSSACDAMSGYRNGRLVATLPAALTDLGLTEVSVGAFTVVLTGRGRIRAIGVATAVEGTGRFQRRGDRTWERAATNAGGVLAPRRHRCSNEDLTGDSASARLIAA